MDTITYVGLDVHKATVCVAFTESGRGGELTPIWIPDASHEAMRDLVQAGDGGPSRIHGKPTSAKLPAAPRPDLSRGSCVGVGLSALADHNRLCRSGAADHAASRTPRPGSTG
jgi:hypothetical protein